MHKALVRQRSKKRVFYPDCFFQHVFAPGSTAKGKFCNFANVQTAITFRSTDCQFFPTCLWPKSVKSRWQKLALNPGSLTLQVSALATWLLRLAMCCSLSKQLERKETFSVRSFIDHLEEELWRIIEHSFDYFFPSRKHPSCCQEKKTPAWLAPFSVSATRFGFS